MTGWVSLWLYAAGLLGAGAVYAFNPEFFMGSDAPHAPVDVATHYLTGVFVSAEVITKLIPLGAIVCFSYQYFTRPRPPAAGQDTMVADPVSPQIVSPTMPQSDDYVVVTQAPASGQALPSVVEQFLLSPVCEPATEVLFSLSQFSCY